MWGPRSTDSTTTPNNNDDDDEDDDDDYDYEVSDADDGAYLHFYQRCLQFCVRCIKTVHVRSTAVQTRLDDG